MQRVYSFTGHNSYEIIPIDLKHKWTINLPVCMRLTVNAQGEVPSKALG